jgi:hypothetical protein
MAFVFALVVWCLDFQGKVASSAELLRGETTSVMEGFFLGAIYQVAFRSCIGLMLLGLVVAGTSFAMKSKRAWSIAGCIVNGFGLAFTWELSRLM